MSVFTTKPTKPKAIDTHKDLGKDVLTSHLFLTDEYNTAKELSNDDSDLFWGNKCVLIEDDDIRVNNIEISGTLTLNGKLFTPDVETKNVNIDYDIIEQVDQIKKSINNLDYDLNGKIQSVKTYLANIDCFNASGDLCVGGDIKLYGNLVAENNNVILSFDVQPILQNYIQIKNNNQTPVISVSGKDPHIDLEFRTKGQGTYVFNGNNLKINAPDNSITLSIPHDLGESYTFTLPNSKGSKGQLLKNDGFGGLIWEDEYQHHPAQTPITIFNSPEIIKLSNDIENLIATAVANPNHILSTDELGNISWIPKQYYVTETQIQNDGVNRLILSNGNNEMIATNNLTFDGLSLKLFNDSLESSNKNNDENEDNYTKNVNISLESRFNEKLSITPIFERNTQSLLKAVFNTSTESLLDNRGKYEFNVDDINVLTIGDNGITIKRSGKLEIGTNVIIEDRLGSITLHNVHIFDNITKNTIEQTITTLPNISSIGTITNGNWNGSVIDVSYGGTGVNNLKNNAILIGNGVNGVISDSNFTFKESVLKLNGSINMSGNINDINGNPLINFRSLANAVNYMALENATLTSNPTIFSSGLDEDIGLNFQSKGRGKYIFKASSNSCEIVVESKNNKTISLKTPDTLEDNFTIILPDKIGHKHQALTSSGSGKLEWSTIPIIKNLKNQSETCLFTSDGLNGLNANSNLTFNGTQFSLLSTFNPKYIIGSNLNEMAYFQTILQDDPNFTDKIIDKLMNKLIIGTKSNLVNAGQIEFNINDVAIVTINNDGLNFRESSKLNIGDKNVIKSSKGLISLNNVNDIDTITLNAIGKDITSLPSLETTGIIKTGQWQGSTVDVMHGGTGQTHFQKNSILIGNGNDGLLSNSSLTFDGVNLKNHVDNATISVGKDDFNNVLITYNDHGKTLDVMINGSSIASIGNEGMEIMGNFTMGKNLIISASNDLITLHNIDSIDLKTQNTIQNNIHSLPNLMTINTITSGIWNGAIIQESYGGTGVTSLDEISTLNGLQSAPYLSTIGTISKGQWKGSVIEELYGGTGVTSLDEISNLNGLQSAPYLSTIGTISNGQWKGSIIEEFYGGTGVTSLGEISALNGLIRAPMLSMVGVINTGVWKGSSVGVKYGGTGQSYLSPNCLLVGNGDNGILAESKLKVISSDDRCSLSVGDNLVIETSNKKVTFKTIDKYEYCVNGKLLCVIDENKITLNGNVLVGSNMIFSNDAGNVALNNIRSLDQITKNTIQNTIGDITTFNNLVNAPSLSSVGTIISGEWKGIVISQEHGGTGVTSLSQVTTLSGLTTVGTISSGRWTGSTISPTYGGTGVSSLSRITTLSGLNQIGTITHGVWNGTVIDVEHGGTGSSSFPVNSIPVSNGTSLVGSDITCDKDTFDLGSCKLSMNSKVIISSNGGTMLHNIESVDDITKNTIRNCVNDGKWYKYKMTIGAISGIPPIKSYVINDIAQYCVIGKTLLVRYDYVQSDNSHEIGSDAYLFSIPPGYVINLPYRSNVGSGCVYNSNAYSTIQVEIYDQSYMQLRTSSGLLVSNVLFSMGSTYSFTATIPIE